MSNCHICSRELDNDRDPLSKDCGGDCLLCMAEAGDPDALKRIWYFTFGQNHTHRVGTVTLDCDSVVCIVGEYGPARAKLVDLIGDKWAFQYDVESYSPHFFSRGVVLLLNA